MRQVTCTYDMRKTMPRVYRTIEGEAYWEIVISVSNEEGTFEVTIRNLQKTPLVDLNDLVDEQFKECLREMSPVTAGGFTVYYLGKHGKIHQ